MTSWILRIRPAFAASVLKAILNLNTRREVTCQEGIFWLDPLTNFGSRLLSPEGYEPETTELVRKLSKDATCVIDLGANEGYFSIVAALAGARKVLAVEPQTRIHPILRRNLELNGITDRVTIAPIAISDKPGPARLNLSPSINTGSSGLFRTTRYPWKSELIEAVTLSQLLCRYSVSSVDLLKVDVEGFETEAILGSRKLFLDHVVSNIIIEFHEGILNRRGIHSDHISSFLRSSGYRRNSSLFTATQSTREAEAPSTAPGS